MNMPDGEDISQAAEKLSQELLEVLNPAINAIIEVLKNFVEALRPLVKYQMNQNNYILMSRNGKHRNKDFTFARRLDRLMVERKLYPSDVQRLTGVHRQCIYEYVQGIKEPNLTSLAKLAHGLKVSADWLLGLKE